MPWVTASPADTASPVTGAGLVGVDGFSIFMASRTTIGSPSGPLALLDGDLDDGALHQRRHRRIARRRLTAALRAGAVLRLAADGAVTDAVLADRQVAGQRHLDPSAVDLDDNLLARQLVGLLGSPARRTARAGCPSRSRSRCRPRRSPPSPMKAGLLTMWRWKGSGGQTIDLELVEARRALERLLADLAVTISLASIGRTGRR